jgi:DNA mismatch repair protein MutS
MSFFADKQTLDDLNIPGRFKNNSISRLFDEVVTAGGRKLMDQMFQDPLTDPEEINKRSSIFKYFAQQAIQFPFTGEEFGVMENYLSSGGGNNILATGMNAISKKVLQIAAQDKDYALLETEVCKTIELLNHFYDFINQLENKESPFLDQLKFIKNIFNHQKLLWIQKEGKANKLSLLKLISYDHLLRTGMHEEMSSLMEMIFHLDVYITVARLAIKRGFCFAHALPKSSNTLAVTGLYHPTVENAIGNSLSLHQNNNVLFLTGANMAGKSTLMKSFGVSIYLAHMGFPVAAEEMQFSVKDGLYSSINVPDNLGMGYSHFYAEVLRVKTVAEEVAADKDLVVIFDELFKGTNVKDAYDATLAITEAFSENRNCFFVISTHIIEVGEALKQQWDNFRFAYLPTAMEGLIPRYTYELKEGITTDRHGMMIIENEGILEMLK